MRSSSGGTPPEIVIIEATCAKSSQNTQNSICAPEAGWPPRQSRKAKMLRPAGHAPVTLPSKAAKNLAFAPVQGQVLGQDEVLLTRAAHRRTSADGEYDNLWHPSRAKWIGCEPNSAMLFLTEEQMPRSDLLISLVRAGRRGDRSLLQKAVEAIAAEERAKKHHVLADQLVGLLKEGGDNSVTEQQPKFNGALHGSTLVRGDAHAQLLVSGTPRGRDGRLRRVGGGANPGRTPPLARAGATEQGPPVRPARKRQDRAGRGTCRSDDGATCHSAL